MIQILVPLRSLSLLQEVKSDMSRKRVGRNLKAKVPMQEVKTLQSMVSGIKITVPIGANNLFPGVHGRLVRLIKAA